MPYIKQKDREELHNPDCIREPMNAGELNFLFTLLIKDYYNSNPCYQTINDIVGALEGAKLEFYRRIAAPYEKIKMKENGDVY